MSGTIPPYVFMACTVTALLNISYTTFQYVTCNRGHFILLHSTTTVVAKSQFCSPPLVFSCTTQNLPVVVVQVVKSFRFLVPQQSSVSCVHMVLHLLIQTLSTQSHPLSCTSSSQSLILEAPVDYSLLYSDSTAETTVPSGVATHRHLQ